jgi:phosphoadenosine phosphosulfate reductase
MQAEIHSRQTEAETFSAERLLVWAAERFGGSAAIASSFGAEDVVLIDLACRLRAPFKIFTLDTDFLFPETYALISQIEERYGIAVERLRATLTPERQAAQFGESLWTSNPDHCCAIRKIDPLTERLKSSSAWITGIRRQQAATRANARKLEWDAKFGLVKLNPLADWTEVQVWEYIREHGVPYNSLHDRGYPSIGCTYCTRAVRPGEDPRAGRWSGLGKTECGLHLAQDKAADPLAAIKSSGGAA